MVEHVPLSTEDVNAVVGRFGVAPRTTALPVVRHDETRDTWLDARQAGIGASDIAAVLGLSPYASPFSLWWAKKLGWHLDSTREMAIGLLLEPLIAGLFGEDHPDLYVCRPAARTYRHADHPWMLASPDFVAVAARRGCQCAAFPMARGEADCPNHETSPPLVGIEPVECKSDDGGHGWGKPGTDQVPEHHRWQVWQQCEVLGARRGHLVRMRGKKLTEYVLPYGDGQAAEYLGVAVVAAKRFMASVAADTPPDPDAHSETEAALKLLYPNTVEDKTVYLADRLAAEFEDAHDALAAAKARYQLARNLVRHRMGSAAVALRMSDGRRVATRRQYKRTDFHVPPAMVDEIRRAT